MKISTNVARDVIEIVESFKRLRTTENHRYASWEFCYALAQCMHERKGELNEGDYDYMALNLAFYLASWGMYRSSFLLQHSYKIHVKVVKLILNDDRLWQYSVSSNTYSNLKESIDEAYEIPEEDKGATDTLLTKIVLGMTGKVVAYDRYCKAALSYLGVSSNFFGTRARSWDKVIVEILPVFKEIIDEVEGEIATYHPYEYKDGHYVMNKEKDKEYPIEKYLDMFLFNLGRLLEELDNAVDSYSAISGDASKIKEVKDSLDVFFDNGVSHDNWYVDDHLKEKANDAKNPVANAKKIINTILNS